MLGRYLKMALTAQSGQSVFVAGRVTGDAILDYMKPDSFERCLDEIRPDVIVNAAAMTELGACQRNPQQCKAVNEDGPARLAELCAKVGIRFIQISTDHYYTNDGAVPHKETDKIVLLNNYAQSKYNAELEVMKAAEENLILRTAIVGFTKKRRTLIDWAYDSLTSGKRIDLFFNTYSSFMHCGQFANVVCELIGKDLGGVYNVGSRDVFSFGEFYLRLAEAMNVRPQYTRGTQLNSEVVRANSRGLNVEKVESTFGLKMPSLDDVVDQVVLDGRAKL